MGVVAGHPSTFNVVTLGCKVNRVEADTIAAGLLAQGCMPVSEERADMIIVNTCTVTGDAEKKARKAVHHALAINPSATVIVTGCAAAIDPDEFKRMDERVTVASRIDIPGLLGIDTAVREDVLRTGGDFRTRVNIKVQDGCNNACSYCIVHTARGEARSIAYDQAIAEADVYFAQGAKEVVLTGINLGSYRSDGHGLTDLCAALAARGASYAGAQEAPARIRLSSIEPTDIDESLIDLMAASDGRICRHLHIPLQAGSSKVLAQMNRPYDGEFYCDLVKRLRNRIPSIALATDVIVGFPGETDDDFEETMRIARECGFMNIHVFPYSMRAGTPAAKRTDQVAHEVKAQRAAALRKLAAELRIRDREMRKGMTEYALVEPDDALTESYHRVAVGSNAQVGSLVSYTFE